jgi:predicted ATPase
MAAKGYAAPEVAQVYQKARELCRQIGETPQLFPVLIGLWSFYFVRAEFRTAYELAEQFMVLAQRTKDPTRLVTAHSLLGQVLHMTGECVLSRQHFDQAIALYHSREPRSPAAHTLLDFGVRVLSFSAFPLWYLGYPDGALQRSNEALALAQQLSHPFSVAYALDQAAILHLLRREGQAAQEQAEATIALCAQHEFPISLAQGTIVRGWALAEQGQKEKGIAQIRQGLSAWRATGAEASRPGFLLALAAECGNIGQVEEGLHLLTEAQELIQTTGGRLPESELHRLKGELTLQTQSKVTSRKSKVSSLQEREAESCFLKAIEIAQRQQAKSLELRATTSLARLWQQQGKRRKAHERLATVYNWFTEGFDTKDLQEAKALIEELSH